MQLLGSLTSPYVRLVRVVVYEKGLNADVELIQTNPMDDSPQLRQANPLGKVPALIHTPVGTLFDSRVICEYLDSHAGPPHLLPAEGPQRWDCQRRVALAQGLMDAAVAIVFERARPASNQSEMWLKRWRSAINQALTELAAQEMAPQMLDLGTITAAVALGYLDFRHPTIPWREQHPALAAWADAWFSRPSMQHTQPPQT